MSWIIRAVCCYLYPSLIPCAFSTVYELDSVMVLTVYHKTALGTGRLIGTLDFSLRSQYGKHGARWFRLTNKNANAVSSSCCGELLLKLVFAKGHLTSAYSTSVVHASMELASEQKAYIGCGGSAKTTPRVHTPSRLRRRSVNGRQSHQYRSPRRSLHKDELGDSESTVPLMKGVRYSTAGDRSIAKESSAAVCLHRKECDFQTDSVLSMCPTYTSSPAEHCDAEYPPHSSSFSMGVISPILADSKSGSAKPTYEDLEETVNGLRKQLAEKESRMNDFKKYMDVLLSRVMENSPHLLESITISPKRH
ncbi:hypothetical protein Tcan_06656 [Toxocara canis]|uniref:FIP-RBD domain-containing protein n=1 Tax=Toxocara canis TaxID=6265 RepID=A0A0B2V1H4_TOXCA|nr:hypothetical protein Tcan_06656 [Toxocara canis]